MNKLNELLLLSKKDSEAFDNYIYSIADTIETNDMLLDKPFTLKKGLVSGYQVTYGYRVAAEKVKDEGQVNHIEVTVYNIFTFLNKAVTEDTEILNEVKSTLLNKLKNEFNN